MTLPTNLSTITGSQSLITTVSEISCASQYANFKHDLEIVYCNWTFDSFLCWPPTAAGNSTQQKCPNQKGLDPSKFAVRKCSTEGFWESKPGELGSPTGWTNYSNCYLPEIKSLIDRLGPEKELKYQIAQRTRLLEIFGFSISLIALIISLVIFYRFRILKNNRTKIHRNLFIAMVIQVLIRLTLYIDKEIIRQKGDTAESKANTRISIDSSPYVCEAFYVLLEYAKTAMFMWMFIEGLYLHNVVTVSVFHGRYPHVTYISIGWGISAVMTSIWAVITANIQETQKCWFGYNLTPYYWILEGPRLVVICLNFIFLLNIIRVLVVKLRQSRTSEVEQVRKAVKAAFVLLPLLGITNMLSMTKAPLDRSALEFAFWSYTTHFLTSFQGFFIAMIYCFLNGEVRAAIAKSINVYMSLRGHHDWVDRRQSFFSVNYPTAADTEQASPHAALQIPDEAYSGGITQHDKVNTNKTNHRRKSKNNEKHRKCYQKWINSIFTGNRTSQIKAEPTPESVSLDLTN